MKMVINVSKRVKYGIAGLFNGFLFRNRIVFWTNFRNGDAEIRTRQIAGDARVKSELYSTTLIA